MAEKTLKTRIINKHDTEANWNKATSFVPKAGEVIIYEADSTYSYPRIKVGDGTTAVTALPFSTDGLVTLSTEQTITGKKTFTTAPEFNSGIAVGGTNVFKVQGGIYNISLPLKSGTVALTSDIPSITTSSTFEDTLTVKDTSVSEGYVSISGSGAIRAYNENYNDTGNELVLNLPLTKEGDYTIATTDDVNEILTRDNTFTGRPTFNGITTFNNAVSCKYGVTATNGSTSTDSTSLKYNCITRSTNNTTYTLTLPTKSGTIALTSDIPGALYKHEIAVDNLRFTLYTPDSTQYTDVSTLPGFNVVGWYDEGNDPMGSVYVTHESGSASILYSGVVLHSDGSAQYKVGESTSSTTCVDTM